MFFQFQSKTLDIVSLDKFGGAFVQGKTVFVFLQGYGEALGASYDSQEGAEDDYERLREALGLGDDSEPVQEVCSDVHDGLVSELRQCIGETEGKGVIQAVRELVEERDALAEEVKVRVQERDSVRDGKEVLQYERDSLLETVMRVRQLLGASGGSKLDTWVEKEYLPEANRLPMEITRLEKLLAQAHETEELIAEALNCPEDTDLVSWAESCTRSLGKCGVWEPALLEVADLFGVTWDVDAGDEAAIEQMLASAKKNREDLDAIMDNSRGLLRALGALGVNPAGKKTGDIEEEARAKADMFDAMEEGLRLLGVLNQSTPSIIEDGVRQCLERRDQVAEARKGSERRLHHLTRALQLLGIHVDDREEEIHQAKALAAEHNRAKLMTQAVERYLNPKQEDEHEGSKYE